MKIIIYDEDQEIIYFDSSIVRIEVYQDRIFIAFTDNTTILFEFDKNPIIKRHIYQENREKLIIKDISYKKIIFSNLCIKSEFTDIISKECFNKIKALINEG